MGAEFTGLLHNLGACAAYVPSHVEILHRSTIKP